MHNCNNVAVRVTQLITVHDTTAPTISTTPGSLDSTVQCASLVPAPNDGAITATDNCGGAVTISHGSDVISNQTCANKYTLKRSYYATDACNNKSLAFC